MKGELEIRVGRADFINCVYVVIRKGNHVATDIVFTELEPNCVVSNDNLMRIRMEEAQVLMDDLWQAGLRPTEGTGSAGALASANKHLEDMRKLVFEYDVAKKKE